MKKFIVSFGFLLLNLNHFHSQNISNKYFRPSITHLYTSFSNDPIIQRDLVEMSKKSLSQKVDLLNISNNQFPTYKFPEAPKKRIFKKKKGQLELANYYRQTESLINESMYDYTRQMLSTWFSRDAKGYMGEAYLNKVAGYSAVQQDMTIDNLSEISRIQDIGFSLIPKSYIELTNVKSISSWKDVYDEQDSRLQKASQRLKIPLVPVLRKNVGYFLDYDVYLYKLKWDDESINDFYKNFYVDNSFEKDINRDEQIRLKNEKIKNFNNMKIGVNLKSIYNLRSQSSENLYASYAIDQALYQLKITPSSKKDVKPNYESVGDVAYQSGNFRAAINLYNKAKQEDPKNKGLTQKIKQATYQEVLLFQKKENEYYGNSKKVEDLKLAFEDYIRNSINVKIAKDDKVKDDFKVTSSVLRGRKFTKLKVPIGTKENILVGQRFVAYEVSNNNGVKNKKYIGHCRVTKKMVQNSGKISGIIDKTPDQPFLPYTTGYSLFTLESGNITEGSILEYEPDKGHRFSFEYCLGSQRASSNFLGDSSMNQYTTVGYGFDLRKIWNLFGMSPLVGPENFSMNLYLHYFLNGTPGAGLSIEKDFYTGFRGLHVTTSLYGGFPMIARGGLGIGYTLNKSMTLAVNKYFGSGSSFGLNLKYKF